MRQKFQYLVVRLDNKSVEDFLNHHGAQGWQYLKQEYREQFPLGLEFTFIRRVSLFDRLFRRK